MMRTYADLEVSDAGYVYILFRSRRTDYVVQRKMLGHISELLRKEHPLHTAVGIWWEAHNAPKRSELSKTVPMRKIKQVSRRKPKTLIPFDVKAARPHDRDLIDSAEVWF